jgi:exodeoxyribonuclease V alpha subunit
LKLFNGDIGIALPDAHGALLVHFADAAGGFRALPALRLPAHETAFAMTVHKAQGSEFDALLVLLPAQRSRVLTRELLYTAVTRARQRVVLAAGAAAVAAAVAAPTERQSGLLARLRDAAAAAA